MTFVLPASLTWKEVAKRTLKETSDDGCLDLAAELSYYFFLALFPAILFLLALASFFPLQNLTDEITRALGPVVSPEVLEIIRDQMRRLGDAQSGGLLTFGIAGALWSSSAALVSIVGALNKAYDITEARPWWKVRLTALGLTVGTAFLILCALSLVLAGPSLAEHLGRTTGMGTAFEWTWKILQWPLVFALVTVGIGLMYYFGPDADQDWVWVTPGAVTATVLWLLISLGFKVYVANFTSYNESYGAVGGVIVLLLWFYITGIAILFGAELNAEIEHASPHGKAPGQKTASGRMLLGLRAKRAYDDQLRRGPAPEPELEVEDVTSFRALPPHVTIRQHLHVLAQDAWLLVVQTLDLALTELRAALAGTARAVVGVGVGIALVLVGVLVLPAALILILVALGIPAWMAALIVTLMLIGGGVATALSSLKSLKSVRLDLPETRQSVTETIEWLRTRKSK